MDASTASLKEACSSTGFCQSRSVNAPHAMFRGRFWRI